MQRKDAVLTGKGLVPSSALGALVHRGGTPHATWGIKEGFLEEEDSCRP